jgi:CheY-like chemotaxis protein
VARILVVDDEDAIRRVLQRTLERAGHSVTAVPDGREAMAAAEAEPFDVVLTDILMPEQEGLETISRLRATQPGLPIIAMSGGGLGSAGHYLHSARLLGASATLEKPFTGTDLLGVLRDVLERPRL